MPDHSILYVKIDLSMYNMLIPNDINDNLKVENKYRHTSKALQDPPADFMKNDNWRKKIDLLIKELETRVQVQQDLDSIYEKLTCAIHNEIDLSLNIKACTKKLKKLLKSSKPYWNDELTTLWKIRKQNENEFLKCKSSKEIKRNKKKNH